MSTVKILYDDGGQARTIRGEIIGEDEIFITIQRSSDGKIFKINRQAINKIEYNNFISKEGS
jgi:hypothetical protein